MITPELKTYMRQQLVAGIAKDVIKQNLIVKGWSVQDLDDAFFAIENEQSAQVAIPPVGSSGHKKSWLRIAMYVIGILLILIVGAYAGLVYYFQKQGLIPIQEPTTNSNVTITNDFMGYHETSLNDVSVGDIFNEVNKQTDFHLYYPTFIPDGIQFNRKGGINWQENDPNLGSWGNYTIGVSVPDSAQTDVIGIDSNAPSIWVMEFKINPANLPAILTRSYADKQDVSISGQNGFLGTTGTSTSKTYNLTYSTNDGVAIRIWSKYFNFDILKQVAESME